MRIAQGTVTKPAGKVFETQYGDKQMMIVTLTDGTEEKFYVKPNSPQSRLQRNENVSVVYEMRQGKQTRRIVIDEDAQSQKQTAPTTTSYNSPKSSYNSRTSTPQVEPREWARGEAANIASLMNTVTKELIKEGFNDVDTEDIRTIAISIYISCQRKFPQGFDLTEPEEENSYRQEPEVEQSSRHYAEETGSLGDIDF